MDRKNRGDERAFPKRAGHRAKDKKEQDCGNVVEENVDQMMTCWLQTKNMKIGHVTQRGQRMPEICVTVGEHPFESVERETGRDVRVFVNVGIVIKVDEAVAKRLRENDPDERG